MYVYEARVSHTAKNGHHKAWRAKIEVGGEWADVTIGAQPAVDRQAAESRAEELQGECRAGRISERVRGWINDSTYRRLIRLIDRSEPGDLAAGRASVHEVQLSPYGDRRWITSVRVGSELIDVSLSLNAEVSKRPVAVARAKQLQEECDSGRILESKPGWLANPIHNKLIGAIHRHRARQAGNAPGPGDRPPHSRIEEIAGGDARPQTIFGSEAENRMTPGGASPLQGMDGRSHGSIAYGPFEIVCCCCGARAPLPHMVVTPCSVPEAAETAWLGDRHSHGFGEAERPEAPAAPPPPDRPKSHYTYADLQDRWGVVRQTIHREVRRGRLKKTLIGGSVRFAAEDVERYENESRF